jgi:hypothetical protein
MSLKHYFFDIYQRNTKYTKAVMQQQSVSELWNNIHINLNLPFQITSYSNIGGVPDSEAAKTQHVLFEYIPVLLYHVPCSISAFANYCKAWATPYQLNHDSGSLVQYYSYQLRTTLHFLRLQVFEGGGHRKGMVGGQSINIFQLMWSD